MAEVDVSKVTDKTPPAYPFIDSLYLEHTNKTYPQDVDVLTLESELDQLSLVIKHCFRDKPKNRTFDSLINPTDTSKVKTRTVFKLDIEEVQMLINKLQEFVDAYYEFVDFNFVVGKHTSLQPWEYDVDIDVTPEAKKLYYQRFPERQKVTVDGIQYNSIKDAPIDKLIDMVKKECEQAGVPYKEVNKNEYEHESVSESEKHEKEKA